MFNKFFIETKVKIKNILNSFQNGRTDMLLLEECAL